MTHHCDLLSRHKKVDTKADNVDRTVLPNSLWVSTIFSPLMADLSIDYNKDSIAKLIQEAITNKKDIFRTQITDWNNTGTQLIYQGQLYIPIKQWQFAMKLTHDIPSMGHPGIYKTGSLLWLLRDAQLLEMRFGRRSKISHTTTKRLCEIADVSHCYLDYKDKEAVIRTKA